MNNKVPSFSLERQNERLKEEISAAVNEVIDSGMFILGKNVKALEKEIAETCGAEFGIGVANGSDALYLSLLACGIGPGDEVITTPFTFFATAGSISRTGAKPVFVDIDPVTYNIDPTLIKNNITPRTRAVIPVHLYGYPADMDPLMQIAEECDLKVIEDAAQALGAGYKGRPVGPIGHAGCISFFPTKNLGAFGDGGMVITNDAGIAEKVKMLRVHGSSKKYYHDELGCNSRLDELQAAVLRVKLQYLKSWTELRREIAELYTSQLLNVTKNTEMVLPREVPENYHVYHQYTIRTKVRDQLREYLKEQGISTTVYYPLPLHLQEVFKDLGYSAGDFPHSESAAGEVLSLPMFPELYNEEVQRVVEKISDFVERGSN